jgi:hypothetical protein
VANAVRDTLYFLIDKTGNWKFDFLNFQLPFSLVSKPPSFREGGFFVLTKFQKQKQAPTLRTKKMTDITHASLEHATLHRVGNSANDEPLQLAQSPLDLTNDSLRELLLHYCT